MTSTFAALGDRGPAGAAPAASKVPAAAPTAVPVPAPVPAPVAAPVPAPVAAPAAVPDPVPVWFGWRRARRASTPSPPGILRSRRTTSGDVASAAARQ